LEQRKRPGKDSGLGYYTSWEKTSENGCIYCGQPATTREHVPSKVFLTEPFPENLPTVPACFECNNGYSDDEKYIACFLDVLKSSIYTNYTSKNDTTLRLEKDNRLKNLLADQIKTSDGKVYFDFDEDRLVRILKKLARGHAGFEFDLVDFDVDNIKLWYDFTFNISEDAMKEFNGIPETDKAPEIGSRGSITPFIVQNIETEEVLPFIFWNDVQDEQYRYQVLFSEDKDISVKIVIYEMLYCKIDFK
jgi:hypothetical protein